MSFSDLNYISVVVGGILHMGLGFLWYGVLFSKPWRSLGGKTQEDLDVSKDKMGKNYVITFVLALFMAAVIQLFVRMLGLLGVRDGIVLGLLLWLAFVGNAQLSNTLFMQKPVRLFLIDSGYFLVSIVLISILYIFWV